MPLSRLIGFTTLLTVLSLGISLAQVESTALTARDLRGAGAWQTDGKSAKTTQRWSLDVKRADDNSLSGRVTFADSPLMQSGNLKGQIVGNLVTGSMSDDDGNFVATFNGQMNKSGFTGSYTDRTGETGAWEWDGDLPQ
jgi:hypothetical protein